MDRSPGIRRLNLLVPMTHSVTTWIGHLRDGNEEAAQQLWERYFSRLVELARRKLHGTSRRAVDEEDVALSAFHSFFQHADRFPQLNNRDDLWQILVMLTARKAFQERRRQQTQKRGGELEADGPRCPLPPTDAELSAIIGNEPSPDFSVMLAEQISGLFEALPDNDLRLVARLRLEEHTNREIAAQMHCSERSIERKLALIRGYWQEAAPV